MINSNQDHRWAVLRIEAKAAHNLGSVIGPTGLVLGREGPVDGGQLDLADLGYEGEADALRHPDQETPLTVS
jgi:hypothetical protein